MKNKIATLIVNILLASLCVAQTVYDSPISGSIAGEKGEAHIVMNPNDPTKMVIGFMNVTATGLNFKIFTTQNGGDTWIASSFNPGTQAGIDYPQHQKIGGGDIIFAYDKDGTLYCSWIYLLANLNNPNYADSCIWTCYWAKSTDNGQTFSFENGENHFFGLGIVNLNNTSILDFHEGICDRQWMDVDLSNGPNANRLYVAYINYPHQISETGLKVKSKLPNEEAFSNQVTAYSGSGQLTNIAVDNNGILHYTFCNIATNIVYHVSSSDGGQTFSNPHQIAACSRLLPSNNFSINGRENAAPSLALDSENNLYLTWCDFPEGSLPHAYYSKSTDGGLTWSAPTDLQTVFGRNVLFPVVSASGSNVTIGGYGIEGDKKAKYYIVNSYNEGVEFDDPLAISSGITDFSNVGLSGFIGDYSTSTRTDCVIYNTWTDYRSGNKQYISKYNICAAAGVVELSPVESTYLLDLQYEPIEEKLIVSIDNTIEDNFSIEIYTLEGKKIFGKAEQIQKGTFKIDLSMKAFSKGKYVFYVRSQDGVMNSKLIEKF